MLVLSHRDRLYSSTLPFVQRRLSFATFTFMVTDHPSCRVYGSAARRVTRESWPLQSTVVQSMPLKEITLCMHPSALPVCKRHRRRREFAVVQPPRKDNIERQPSSALAFSRKVDHHRVVVLIVRHPLGTYCSEGPKLPVPVLAWRPLYCSGPGTAPRAVGLCPCLRHKPQRRRPEIAAAMSPHWNRTCRLSRHGETTCMSCC